MTPDETYRQVWNLAPSMLAPIVRLNADGERELATFRFGFQPTWARRAWINARRESVFTSKAFAAAARKRRCLVPVIGWYEWSGRKAPRRPHVVHLDGFRPLSLAGIWTAREIDGGWLHNFGIITRPATPGLERIHERMPATVRPQDYDTWLSPDTTEDGALAVIDEPVEHLQAYEVGTYVNKPEHNDPRCIEPLDARAASPHTFYI